MDWRLLGKNPKNKGEIIRVLHPPIFRCMLVEYGCQRKTRGKVSSSCKNSQKTRTQITDPEPPAEKWDGQAISGTEGFGAPYGRENAWQTPVERPDGEAWR